MSILPQYVEDGRVDFSVNTIAYREGNWYLFKGCQLQFVTTVAQNAYGWWCIRDGLLDFTYTGVAANEYGFCYIENGCLNWNYSGTAEDMEGNLYQVTNGFATPL